MSAPFLIAVPVSAGSVLTSVLGSVGSGTFDTAGRLGLDVVSMLLLVGWLYRRRVAAPEMALVYTALNVGLFAAVTTIGSGHFPTGIGFGLFGLLSLVRLRSAAFTLKDVAYTFVALVLALVNGLPERNLILAVCLDVLLLGAVWLVDESRTAQPTQMMRMMLDRAMTQPSEVSAAVALRLGAVPISVKVEAVDYVRDTTRVVVRYAVAESDAAPPATDGPDPDNDEWAEAGARVL
jgi:hypothetical protein